MQRFPLRPGAVRVSLGDSQRLRGAMNTYSLDVYAHTHTHTRSNHFLDSD